MRTLILVALAGAVGTLARYGLSQAVQGLTGAGFPWGTFTVNMLGSFLFGVVIVLAEEKGLVDAETRLILLTGFMGAFTTFSTFIYDTGKYLHESQLFIAFLHIAGQVLIGLLFLFGGMALARWL